MSASQGQRLTAVTDVPLMWFTTPAEYTRARAADGWKSSEEKTFCLENWFIFYCFRRKHVMFQCWSVKPSWWSRDLPIQFNVKFALNGQVPPKNDNSVIVSSPNGQFTVWWSFGIRKIFLEIHNKTRNNWSRWGLVLKRKNTEARRGSRLVWKDVFTNSVHIQACAPSSGVVRAYAFSLATTKRFKLKKKGVNNVFTAAEMFCGLQNLTWLSITIFRELPL